VVDYQSTVFQMKNLHGGQPPVDKDENFSVLNVALHLRFYDTAKGVKTFAHIYRCRIKKVL
jgi:hypothetical protein